MNIRNTVALTAVAALAVIGLAGCAAGGATTKPTSSSTTTPKPVAESTDGAAPKTGACDHGQMTIVDADLAEDRSFTVEKSCELVAIVASDAHVTVAKDVKTLTIEGSNNTVTTEHVEQALGMGGNNTVSYTGAAPEKVSDDDTTVYEQR